MGVVDWDGRLFDALIPLPDGTSYNAYLVRGSEKIALIDTVEAHVVNVLLDQLADTPKIDYVISQHAEQDHSGSLHLILDKYPEAKLVTSTKGKDMLMPLLPLLKEDRIITVEDGETLSLGDKTLKFIYTPWVHWPETMCTYLAEDKILFTCDLYGSHYATSDIFVSDFGPVYTAAKRYYAEIMMPFQTVVQKDMEKLNAYDVATIAPSHGPLYNQPEKIIRAYQSWVSGKLQNKVVLPWTSMHGSTREMVEYFTNSLVQRGVMVERFNLTVTDIGMLAMALVEAPTVVFGAPTVLGGPHPNIVSTAYLVNAFKPRVKYLSVIGSYGWAGRSAEQIAELTSRLKAEMLPSVVCRGAAREAEFHALDALADVIVQKHASL